MPDSTQLTQETVASAFRLLNGHPDFRVLRRLVPTANVTVHVHGALQRGVAVDVETTGLNSGAALLRDTI